jgi:hypothetical protein
VYQYKYKYLSKYAPINQMKDTQFEDDWAMLTQRKYVSLDNSSGAFTAKLTVDYYVKGSHTTEDTGDITAGRAGSIFIPNDATNISLKIEVMTWWPPPTWATCLTRTYDKATTVCFKSSGTTLMRECKEIPCP